MVDPESGESNIELGTVAQPYRMMDDAFRELFNRESIFSTNGKDFNVTIYLKAGNQTSPYEDGFTIVKSNHSIYGIQAPLLLININIEIK